ncbi:hypothetical protein J7E96_19450 [Streptomyces sp. ISL-96]|uniref:hypothetical protein n=1 Tax=Streptomyces sp. ISL-96 TaxID=2819191 RepID=UPI001BE6FBF4|nr:hypothetical protein [Streptomyces sp. ISL-96]MBT2490651.1 hypothetical protein [Streptomyces sp. ISL-96]
MLSAAEAAIDDAAEDEAQRERNRAELYAPPRAAGPGGRRVRPPPAARLDQSGAQALMAQLAAEDTQLAGRRTG